MRDEEQMQRGYILQRFVADAVDMLWGRNWANRNQFSEHVRERERFEEQPSSPRQVSKAAAAQV